MDVNNLYWVEAATVIILHYKSGHAPAHHPLTAYLLACEFTRCNFERCL